MNCAVIFKDSLILQNLGSGMMQGAGECGALELVEYTSKKSFSRGQLGLIVEPTVGLYIKTVKTCIIHA